MTTTPASRLPQFITDGGIETHIIFNMGVELPHFSAFPLNDSAAGREVIRSYYRDYMPVARAAGRSFLFATDSWRASPDWADRLGYDRALLKQNNATSAALCAELADELGEGARCFLSVYEQPALAEAERVDAARARNVVCILG